jgi:hypothetical protein
LFLKSQIEEKSKALGVVATPKVCIPSPTMVHFRGGRASIDIGAYPDLDVFFEDLAKVYQEELDSLYKAGARFVQLDDTNLAYLCDEKMRQQAAERNEDVNSLPKRYAVSSLFELSYVGAIIPERLTSLPGAHQCGHFETACRSENRYPSMPRQLPQSMVRNRRIRTRCTGSLPGLKC